MTTKTQWPTPTGERAMTPHQDGLPALPEPVASVSKGPVAFFVKFKEARGTMGKYDLFTADQMRAYALAALAALPLPVQGAAAAQAVRYTKEMGAAGDAYINKLGGLSSTLPSMFRWEDCLAAMLAAHPSALPACQSCGSTATRDVPNEATDFPGPYCDGCGPGEKPASPERKPLTEGQIIDLCSEICVSQYKAVSYDIAIARVIEAAHGIAATQPANKPHCRDCADFGPICPNSGLPCAGIAATQEPTK